MEAEVRAASRLAAILAPGKLRAVERCLLNSKSGSLDTQRFIDEGLSRTDVETLDKEIARFGDERSLLALAVALRVMGAQAMQPQVEVCWTGPKLDVPLRSTGPVIEQLVLQAQDRVLLAEFDITEGAQPILDLLEKRVLAGVKVCFIVDRGEEKKALMEWAKRFPEVEVWSRPISPTDPLSKLHVKSILVDGRVAVFGSANLTHYGLQCNIEMGVVVRDPQVVTMAEEALLQLRRHLKRLVPGNRISQCGLAKT